MRGHAATKWPFKGQSWLWSTPEVPFFLSHQSGPAPMMDRRRFTKRHCKDGVGNAWWPGVKARTSPQALRAGVQVTRGWRSHGRGWWDLQVDSVAVT